MTDYFDEHAPVLEPEEQERLEIARALAELNALGATPDTAPASKAAIAKLEVHKIEKNEEVECPICKMNGNEEDNFKILPCKHEFHEGCILLWFEKTNSCPMCRLELETDDPGYEEYRRYRAEEQQRNERVEQLLNNMFT